MIPNLGTLGTIGQDSGEARGRIEATRSALQAALDAQEPSDGDLAALVACLDRMVADLARIEATMPAGLSDQIWSTKEWNTYPAKPR